MENAHSEVLVEVAGRIVQAVHLEQRFNDDRLGPFG